MNIHVVIESNLHANGLMEFQTEASTKRLLCAVRSRLANVHGWMAAAVTHFRFLPFVALAYAGSVLESNFHFSFHVAQAPHGAALNF